ncbi:hypothetical protein A3E65_02825 [Candidatus Kaiserbacteria bacterium RIFCSPHIGHO2_12_FULL_56_13]|uniref:Uncharacterized protein n=2 Tax=Candidatus Kaiseribacteriota TaxID=1752734 RepID=A0A1F6E285_9BACT|nr:MAG: hypothetical protein A3C95_02205 [Candidatus Kaiserbacteria bacterium RIFCSPHIGHO2_02_FULL_56_30]OGG71846.1 MAG: hypothetical protein A3E65_02825 [Candidatus Kaiserbacteria bacterium RIFCSPHIGHO2_12_FULL_56_13]
MNTVETGLNLEYWFRLIYECVTGGCYGVASLSVWLAELWQWIIIVGYAIIVLGLLFIVYAMMRIYDLRKREEEQLGELIVAPEAGGPNPRWEHIESLMEASDPASWRQAIIEADIVLDEMLTRQGYAGDSVGEKLKQIEPSDFDTLEDAWEAHKVRNQIAHTGSSFDLSEVLARRTMARYEAVFREFKFI